MKKALTIMSWAAIVLGGLAILGGFSENSAEEAMFSFVGGLLFGVEGLLAILYIKETEKTNQ
jgi:hypothetical protein